MISVYKLKPAFQRLLTPLMRGLRRFGVTPNHLSFLAIVLSGFMGYALWKSTATNWYLLLVPLGLLLRMALNAMDGMMATQFDLKTTWGEILNEFGDMISDIFIILPMFALPGIEWWMAVVFTLLALLNESAGILAKAISGTRRYDGPMGKSDRALFVSLLAITYYFYPEISAIVQYIFMVVTLLILISTSIRLKKSVL